MAILSQGPSAAADYKAALSCAGLTQAASELEGGESRYGRALADAALFWTLTSFQAAAAANINYVTAETDQRNLRLQSVRRLSLDEPLAKRQLQQCRQKTPRLN